MNSPAKRSSSSSCIFPKASTRKRLLLVGAGKPEKFSPSDLRKIAGTALRYLKSRGVKKFVFLAREGERGPAAAQAVTEGLGVADFESNKYQTEKKASKEIQSVILAGFDANQNGNLPESVEHGRVIAESQNFARDLINEPSNRLTPRMLAARAEAMAKEVGLGVEILDERKISELKMGALIGVAQGSVEPPRVIVIRYTPENARPDAPVLGLVGKAVTFDTGGISIKPADNMEKMKYDMGGGATMLGAMRAIAYLKPKVPVIAVIPATENMPGGRAQKPGDIQVAMSGKTIEVINTDAEGRMILADGVFYARKLGATHLIDAATLTGAIQVRSCERSRRSLRHPARISRSIPRERQSRRRKNVAHAHGRRVRGNDQKQYRRHPQHRLRQRRRRHHRRLVHKRICRRHPLDPPRHRRNVLGR